MSTNFNFMITSSLKAKDPNPPQNFGQNRGSPLTPGCQSNDPDFRPKPNTEPNSLPPTSSAGSD